jgi:hypothetical protein
VHPWSHRSPRISPASVLSTFQSARRRRGAQQLFDQGLRLLYAFDDREALRAFLEAAQVDPDLAMACWGQAMALGPNLRFQLTADRERRAYEATRRASAISEGASDRERGLIEAMQARFAESPTPRAVLDRGYADAMELLAGRYPDDPDIQTLYVDALLNTMAGNYWEENGERKLDTGTIVGTLERVIVMRQRWNRHQDSRFTLPPTSTWASVVTRTP